MKYEEFEGSVEELVLLKLKEIEEKEHIKVLHVIESGSRAWGFASPDSDYDVRFIYMRDEDFYLSLRDTKDFIDWELNEVLDINGWDLKKAYYEYLMDDMVKYKKYFYVLRPILACKWIEEKKCPPPVLFDELFNSVLEEDMKAAVEELLAKKVRMSESDQAPKIEKINQYIEEKLSYYKALAETMRDDRNPDWEPLEAQFRKMVRESTLYHKYNDNSSYL